MNVFVVISIAIPKGNIGTNPPGARVNAVCKRSTRAEEIARNISSSKETAIVGGVECQIRTVVVDIELDES